MEFDNKYVVLDCEVYPNYFLIAFKNITNNKTAFIEIKGKDKKLTDKDKFNLCYTVNSFTLFGFNSRNFDIPIILYALKDKTAYEIYLMCKDIIENSLPYWETFKKYNLQMYELIKHFDIQEPAPAVMVSLKLYGARLNSTKLQDLPLEPDTVLTDKQMEEIKTYCINDLDTTIDLYRAIRERIELRIKLSEEYKQDLLSKSDAQIAEAIIKSKLCNLAGKNSLRLPELPDNYSFRYKLPPYITFKSNILNEKLEFIKNYWFELDNKGSVKLPTEFKSKFKLGFSEYKIGVGGLHSNEKNQVIIPKEDEILIDKDVTSYYPSIILNRKLYPRHLGIDFLNVYKDIVDKRIEAKKKGDEVVNQSLKIVINGTFGKLGNKYSILYSPELLLAVTLTGQLALLMLIDELEYNNIKVVSANTDGIVSLVNKKQYDEFISICFNWELQTGFNLEDTFYKFLYSRDVNNYMGLTILGKVKRKGMFKTGDITKNNEGSIIVKAISDYIIKNIPIEKTIKECGDIKDFIFAKKVNGGAIWKEEYLGKVCRWYWSTEGEPIYYRKAIKSGAFPKVARSDGAKPIMNLDIEFPQDIDYDKYIDEAYKIINEFKK